jgi:tetratricopeptide (TPR) repeat protein
MARIRLLEGGRERIIELGDATIRIGRSPDNAIALEDLQSSRNHCEIESSPLGFKLIDLESKNGTKVNGKFINQHLLVHLDRVEIGNAVLLFEDSREAAAPAVLELGAVGGGTAPPPPARPVLHGLPSVTPVRIVRPPLRGPRLPAAASSILFFAIVVALILGIVMFLTKEDPELTKTRGAFDRGRELAETGRLKYTKQNIPLYKITEFEEARAEYEKVSPKFPDFYSLARQELGELKGIIERAQLQKRSLEETQAFNDLLQYVQYVDGNPKDAQEILERCKSFKTKYPQSSLISQVEAVAARARESREVVAEEDFAATQEICKSFVNGKQYGRAVTILQEFIVRSGTAEQKKEAETVLRDTISDAESFFELKNEEAQKLAREKKYREAIEIHEMLLKCLGEEKVLDFDVLCLRAKKEIERLQETMRQ